MISVIDTETTFFKKGNPFARRNKLCYVGTYQPGQSLLTLPATEFHTQRPALDASEFLVFFNAKFDLHWLRRSFGWAPSAKQRVWDCQLGHFLLTSQRQAYPSLAQCREHYSIERATVKASADYWTRGIDTPDIPAEIILEDLKNDVLDTYKVYQNQLREFTNNPVLYNLFRLDCSDLLVLAEMEWNGINFNVEEAKKQAEQIRVEISGIEGQLRAVVPIVPINFNSPEHISALLYGGIIHEDTKVLAGVVKTGSRAGQPRFTHERIDHVLPQLCVPLEGTALKKDGYFSTDESTIRQLDGHKPIRDQLLRRAKLSKELDYLDGLPKLIAEMDWDENVLHTSFNQCVATTGRLSSSKPNVQNATDTVLKLMETRYD